jgi:hypothetical protein
MCCPGRRGSVKYLQELPRARAVIGVRSDYDRQYRRPLFKGLNMFDRFIDFWSDGPGALPLAVVVIAAGPAFILWLNVMWIMGGN